MFKLVLEKAEEPETKLPTSAGSWKKQESSRKASAYNVGDLSSIPGSGRSPGEGNGSPCQYSCLPCPQKGVKEITSLDSILKSRVITLPTKVRLVKAMVFPVVMYGCESWTTKKVSAEELMLFLESLLDCKKIKLVNPKGNQS